MFYSMAVAVGKGLLKGRSKWLLITFILGRFFLDSDGK